jgi:sugar phosphate isomerase/epimerase
MSYREMAVYLNPHGAQRRQAMAAIAGAGIRLIGTDGCTWHPDRDRRDIDAFLADLAALGLSVQSMHAVQPILARADHDTPPDLLSALRTDLRRMVLLGGKTAVYHACWMRDVAPEQFDQAIAEVGWDAFVGRYARTVKLLAQEAARSGITIVIENVWHSTHAQSVTGFMDILHAANEPNVGICLDSGHTHLVGGLSVGDEVRAAGSLLRDTHFHDNVGPVGDQRFDQHIPPGLGTINWQDVCRALDEVSFHGPVVFEGILGPGDSIAKGRFGGRLSYQDLIQIAVRNWRAFESFAGQQAS